MSAPARERPTRILHLRDTHEIGGPGKTILETFRAIDRSRFDLHLGVFETRHEDGRTPFVLAAEQAAMPVHHIRGFNQYDLRIVRRVIDLIEALGIDILHAHEVKSDVIAYCVSKLHPVPIITTLHGWIGNRAKDRAMIALDKRVLRAFDRVIAVSAPIFEALRTAGVPANRLRLLHNAIVVERYRKTGQQGLLGSLIGRPIVRPVITTIGRLSVEKGHADLIEALAILAARGVKVTTVLVGDGPERAPLQQKVRMLGLEEYVSLPGYNTDTARILEDTDLMVLPSHTEGLPNVALEALAMEVPVLATRVGGTPEVVLDGKTGRLVEPRSPSALADALAEFLMDPAPWQRMARRGRELVETEFDFGTRTRRLEGIYNEMSGGMA
jgi:glycosyltransferase involved in cell wall biosynthesis